MPYIEITPNGHTAEDYHDISHTITIPPERLLIRLSSSKQLIDRGMSMIGSMDTMATSRLFRKQIGFFQHEFDYRYLPVSEWPSKSMTPNATLDLLLDRLAEAF